MNKPLLLISLLLTIFMGFSQEVTLDEAKTVATNFLSEKDIGQEIISISNHSLDHSAFILCQLEKGFLLLSPDKRLQPIIGWSLHNAFNTEILPPALEYLFTYYDKQIYFVCNQERIDISIHPDWTHYLAPDFKAKNRTGVGPFLTSQWDQGCYYNTWFPEESQGPCGHLYAGCVAVAMGQIMNFWEYPEHGFGSNSYYSSGYGTISADFENTFYQWNAMEDQLDGENDAVAELIFQTAVSVNTQFFPQGSGAYDHHIPDAIIDHFGFADIAAFIFRDDYTANWSELIIDELNTGRPFIYGGVEEATQAGHTFICDGYQDNNSFHINWGWGGLYNGYFALNNLVLGNYTFDTQHDVVIGLAPMGQGSSVYEQSPYFTIHPNPAQEVVIIEPMDGIADFAVFLLNSQGQIVVEQTDNSMVNIRHLPAGIYFLKIITPQTNHTYTLSVIH